MLKLKNYQWTLILVHFLFGIILLGFTSISAKSGGDWFDKLSEINLGATSRAGIEKLFEIETVGEENVSFEQIDVSYGTDSGYLKVRYASGKGCSKITNMGYKLDKDIVVSYFFFAHEEIKFSRSGLNFDDLIFNEWDDEKERIYSNPKTGMNYYIRNKSLISGVGQSFTLEKLRKFDCRYFIDAY